MEHTERAADKRRLRIYATDPMSGRRAPYRISIDIDNEPDLKRGPRGALVEVFDYDGWNQQFYPPVNLNEPRVLMEGGLAPSESDPRFHQQMVYAVAMKVIENSRPRARPADHVLPRREPAALRLFPHAFYGAQRLLRPGLQRHPVRLLHGRRETPGQNLPGQTVFTCLSHDIIAHEMTHAIVHRLRRYFIEPTNSTSSPSTRLLRHRRHVPALLLSASCCAEHIQASAATCTSSNDAGELAQQFGHATGRDRPCAPRIDESPTRSATDEAFEPHERGAILVGAVFDGFFSAYQNRIADLSASPPAGPASCRAARLHPDLVNRLAAEASQLRRTFLTHVLPRLRLPAAGRRDLRRLPARARHRRLRAQPADPDEVRFERSSRPSASAASIPAGVQSLAEEALLWPNQLSGPIPDWSPISWTWRASFSHVRRAALDQVSSPRRKRRDEGIQCGSRRRCAEPDFRPTSNPSSRARSRRASGIWIPRGISTRIWPSSCTVC